MELRIIPFERAPAATSAKIGKLQIDFSFKQGVWLCTQLLDHVWILEFLGGNVDNEWYIF